MPNIAYGSSKEKIVAAMQRSKRYLPAAVGAQVDALLSPANIGLVVGTLTLWAGSHFFGVGEIVDVALLLVGALTIGWSIGSVLEDLVDFAQTAISAKGDEDIDKAARAFANAITTAGITAVTAILLRRSAKQIQATRGTSVTRVGRPVDPGLVAVEEDVQAGVLWRKPTIKGDPNMPAGTGETSAFGDVWYSTAGKVTEQTLAKIHELVHSALSPRFRPLRRFRAQLAMSAYSRSALMTYLEEALAETVAQLRVNGLQGLMTGIKFPIANGYITLQQLACEGAEIGTVVVGTQRFSAQFIPAGPPGAYSDD
jgi:hypothetical protein